MPGFPSPFGGDGGSGAGGSDARDADDEFVPDRLPDPGPFLADHEVLTGDAHVAFHEATRQVFEERTVYDATFGYNLARLNHDARHPDAGYRYAEETGADGTLRAEFTPTTPFCPQSHALTVGSFRAWNGLADRHGYDLVRVRVHPMHQAADRINDRLATLGARFRQTGTVADGGVETDGAARRSGDRGAPRDGDGAPF